MKDPQQIAVKSGNKKKPLNLEQLDKDGSTIKQLFSGLVAQGITDADMANKRQQEYQAVIKCLDPKAEEHKTLQQNLKKNKVNFVDFNSLKSFYDGWFSDNNIKAFNPVDSLIGSMTIARLIDPNKCLIIEDKVVDSTDWKEI